MPTQTVRFTGRTGLTLTADVLVDSTGASFAAGVTVTESSGVYSFDLTDSAGVYRVQIKRSGSVIDNHFVKTTNTAATFDTVIERASISRADTLADVLADTSELQTNQGNWLTANVSALALETTAQQILEDTAVLPVSFPANFAALGISEDGEIEHVLLVDLTTENSDMRGTDGANTATPLDAAGVAEAVWDALPGDHEVNGSYGAVVLIAQGSERAVSVDNSHRVHAAVYEMRSNVIDSGSLASSAIVAMGNYQIPQTVPAVGTAPTRDQAIAMMAARGLNAVHVGTTETVYKADGTTAMYTLTLTNDGTYTTAIERAT
jgi:hypothetical protein